jgi:hypothetical protein
MPSHTVAKLGVDALARDSGTVITGLPTRLNAVMCRLMPRRILLPLLRSRHPALRRNHAVS